MFKNFNELTIDYINTNNLLFSSLEITSKKLFKYENVLIFKRYKKDYKRLFKFERKLNFALNKYWKFKELEDKENVNKWFKLIRFLYMQKKVLVENELEKKALLNKKKSNIKGKIKKKAVVKQIGLTKKYTNKQFSINKK